MKFNNEVYNLAHIGLTPRGVSGLKFAGVYGKGAADDIIESAVGKLAKTDSGRNALRFLAKSTGEGAEELIENKLDPLVSAIYDNGEALKAKYGSGWEGYKEAAIDDLYAGLIGFALGAGGQAVSAARGDYARANAQLPNTSADTQTQTEPVEQTQSAVSEGAQTSPTAATQPTGDISTPPTAQNVK